MKETLWKRYQDTLCICEDIHLSLDISRMRFSEDFMNDMKSKMNSAFSEMDALMSGAIANPDENRMVGHYWLRAPELAPTQQICNEIRAMQKDVRDFAADVHAHRIVAPNGAPYTDLLVIGIGGSALGPQWVASALSDPDKDAMRVYFLDNTDPEGIIDTLKRIPSPETTMIVVISKSGSTPETRNGMLTAQKFFEDKGLPFASRSIAITGDGSKLYKTAQQDGWLKTFPMWDWVGGRTSELSAVGLLPAALQGIDIDAMLAGAAACDVHTAKHDLKQNPAALMALMWYYATNGKGEKDLVILPYKDKLLLFARYLQQLIMESLGKRYDLDGKEVFQGLTVYGNKGSTDQHAYVQQLRDGIANYFATFIDVLEYGAPLLEVDPDTTPGDYLHGFLLGTRAATYESGRDSMTITVNRIDARSIGTLIALFERTVGYYAFLIHINAYHQPGVEAGKKAASRILDLQRRAIALFREGTRANAETLAQKLATDDIEDLYRVLTYLHANGRIQSNSDNAYCFNREFFM